MNANARWWHVVQVNEDGTEEIVAQVATRVEAREIAARDRDARRVERHAAAWAVAS